MKVRAPPCCVLCGTDKCLATKKAYYLSMQHMQLLNKCCKMALPFNQTATFRVCGALHQRLARAKGNVSIKHIIRMAIDTAEGPNPELLVSTSLLLLHFTDLFLCR